MSILLKVLVTSVICFFVGGCLNSTADAWPRWVVIVSDYIIALAIVAFIMTILVAVWMA